MSMPRAKVKLVWGSVERRGKRSWTQIGYAWDAGEGGIMAQLSAFPMNGQICIRDGIDEVVEMTVMVEEAM